MGLRNTTSRWGLVAQVLHWAMALLILIMIVLGWVMVWWPLTPLKVGLFALHKSTGIMLLTLAVARIAWRLVNPTPRLPDTLKPYERALARITHPALYVLLLAMPMSGWIIHSASNFPLLVYGLFPLPTLVPPSTETQHLAERVHLTLSFILIGVLTLHIAAALKHHVVLKDDVLTRMLPRRGPSREAR
ncbi:MAG: cytochrome b [Inquilinaceae bacterium]